MRQLPNGLAGLQPQKPVDHDNREKKHRKKGFFNVHIADQSTIYFMSQDGYRESIYECIVSILFMSKLFSFENIRLSCLRRFLSRIFDPSLPLKTVASAHDAGNSIGWEAMPRSESPGARIRGAKRRRCRNWRSRISIS
jgi:hypothetical protein